MAKQLHVLVIEDSQNDTKLLIRELSRGGWEIAHERVDTPANMQAALAAHPWDVIIADYSMPSFSGPAALMLAREQAEDVPFILVSGQMGEETAVQAMKAGADDYLFKGDLQRLVPVITRELRDAEAQKNARAVKRELAQREAQLFDALRLAHLGTWHVDFKTGTAVWSDETCDMLGIIPSLDVQTSLQFLACIHPQDKAELNRLLADNTVTTIDRNCRLACPEKVERFVYIRGEIVRNQEGHAIEAAGMIQDVTQHHLAQLQIQQAREDAERANKAKSEFLANMSHEIRTPMTAILGFIELMAQPDQSAIERAECIQTVRRNAAHLLELINDILDLSKIEAGGMTVESIPCDVGKLITDLVAIMQPRAVEKSLGFDVSFRRPLPAEILTDPLRLQQILVNLLNNAIKFTAAGHVKLVFDAEISDMQVKLKVDVSDSGIGLSPEQITRLFRPFTQAEESTTRKFGGTGLGLTISQQLAKLLGGEITLASTPGVGSTFSLQINAGFMEECKMLSTPQSAISSSSRPTAEWTAIPLRGRILLAEDGRDNQRLLSNHLRASGAEVVIAENGQIAVDLACKESFDLILMDMQMPVMDGYTAAATLRVRGFTLPIIALTACAMAEDRIKCTASGCTDYLSKPIDRTLLLTTVREHLAGRQISNNPAPAVIAQSTQATNKLKSSLIDYPGMKDIIVEFVEGLPLEVAKMSNCLQRADMDGLRRLIHQLRGASGGYGFDEITEPATQAEMSIQAGKNIELIGREVGSLLNMIRAIDGYVIDKGTTTQIGSSDERVANLHC